MRCETSVVYADVYRGGGGFRNPLLLSFSNRRLRITASVSPGQARSGPRGCTIRGYRLLSTAKLIVPGFDVPSPTFMPTLYCRCIANDARNVFRFYVNQSKIYLINAI